MITAYNADHARLHQVYIKGVQEANDSYHKELAKRGLDKDQEISNWNEIQKNKINQLNTLASLAVDRKLHAKDTRSRDLTLQGSANLLESDSLVILPPSDNMFHAFIGTKGTFTDGSGVTGLSPLNMSLSFP